MNETPEPCYNEFMEVAAFSAATGRGRRVKAASTAGGVE